MPLRGSIDSVTFFSTILVEVDFTGWLKLDDFINSTLSYLYKKIVGLILRSSATKNEAIRGVIVYLYFLILF